MGFAIVWKNPQIQRGEIVLKGDKGVQGPLGT